MLLIQRFDNEDGRNLIAQKMNEFGEILEKLCDIYQIRPFTHQSVQSLTEMYLLTLAVESHTILEIGCGSRSSTIALASAAAELEHDCVLYGLDIAPTPFEQFSRINFPNLNFCKVVDIVTDVTQFEIPDDWERPILTLYDAHDEDILGSVISSHAILNWFPKLSGQVIAMHDFSVFPADDPFAPDNNHVMALHFSNRKIIGFREVTPLVSWMNELKIDFTRPGDELAEMGFKNGDSSLIYFTAP